MRAVQHIDLYLSSTDKCIIDANCWDSILFGSPFIFPTRYLVHQVLSWSWNTQLGSSNAVFHSKCISCYYIQLHFPKHQRMRQTAPDQLQWQDHPSCVSAVQDNVWNNLKAEYCPPAIVTPLLQEVQLWSSYASISRVFAHPACRYRFLIDKYETEVWFTTVKINFTPFNQSSVSLQPSVFSPALANSYRTEHADKYLSLA